MSGETGHFQGACIFHPRKGVGLGSNLFHFRTGGYITIHLHHYVLKQPKSLFHFRGFETFYFASKEFLEGVAPKIFRLWHGALLIFFLHRQIFSAPRT